MTKKLASKLEDYKAPWEVDSDGKDVPEDEQTVDPAKLKKYLYGLLTDKDRLQNTVTSVTEERDSVKQQLDAKTREGEGDEQKRQREHDEALAKAKAEGALEAAKLRAALKVKGITPEQAEKLASRLKGEKPEDFEEDANALAEDFGIGKATDDGDDGDEPITPATRPKRLRSAGDPTDRGGDLPASDAETVNKTFPRR